MLFDLSKRKFLAIAERDEVATSGYTDGSEAGSPRKRLRVEETASTDEVQQSNSQDACAAGPKEAKKQKKMKALREKIKKFEELSAQFKKRSEPYLAAMKKLKDESTVCAICHEVVNNPQILQCGHTACYLCLRLWWTQPHFDAQDVNGEIINTDTESALEEENSRRDRFPANHVFDQPRRLRRHIFRSVVNCQKHCPCCNEEVNSRPTPDIQTHAIVERVHNNMTPLPADIKARRAVRSVVRKDIWHGIFKPEPPVVSTPVVIRPIAPPLPHPDPILNNFAQAQFRRALQQEEEQLKTERTKAFEKGRTVGKIEAINRHRQADADRRAAVAQQAAMPQPPPVEDPALFNP